MVRADGVDLLNLVAERHRLVDDELQELVRRGLAREQLELSVDRAAPRDDDAGADLPVPIPHKLRASEKK